MSKELDYIAELENQNRLLGERCNQLLKDKGELTDHLAEEVELHLHAEDYIKSLEQKLEQTEKDLADYQFNYPKIKELEKENAELKAKNKWYSEQVCNKECAEVWGNLAKAKKLLKQFLEAKNSEDTYKAEWEAEQFLKEIKEND